VKLHYFFKLQQNQLWQNLAGRNDWDLSDGQTREAFVPDRLSYPMFGVRFHV
jgi:hypothetical protein